MHNFNNQKDFVTSSNTATASQGRHINFQALNGGNIKGKPGQDYSQPLIEKIITPQVLAQTAKQESTVAVRRYPPVRWLTRPSKKAIGTLIKGIRAL